MTNGFVEDAAAAVLDAADRAPVRPEFDGARWLPIRADSLAHLLEAQAEQARILRLICERLGIDPDAD